MLSIRSECLDRIIPFGEGHLRRAVSQYVRHYHEERSHQGFGNVLIDSPAAANDNGRVRRHQRLGGLLSYSTERPSEGVGGVLAQHAGESAARTRGTSSAATVGRLRLASLNFGSSSLFTGFGPIHQPTDRIEATA